ncbi:MAG: FtsX-like permease family protein [Lachnospiraceae bacterium]|nr:FtsX-like permease family protein [Lachnospiraceae bacterium]
MKKRVLTIEWMREIRLSLPRFFSILFLVMLGVAFFSGIRATEPDMRLTADAQYDAEHFMDIRVISTLGLTDEDVEAIQKIEGVEDVEGAYTYDVLMDMGNSETTMKVYSLTDRISNMKLMEGRMPKEKDECLLDIRFAQNYDVKIGDTLSIKSGNSDKLSDTFAVDTYKVTGFASYSQYLTRDRGTTSIANGKLSGFLAVPPESFDLDVFTDLYVTVKGAKSLTVYTDAYDDCVEAVTKRLEDIEEERTSIRYEKIKTEAEEKIADAQKKYKKEKKKTLKKLQEAQDELDDAKKKMEDGRKELEESEKTLTAAEKKLASGREQYEKGLKKYEAGKKSYEAGLAEYKNNETSLHDMHQRLEEQAAQFGVGLSQLTPEYGELYEGYQQYLGAKSQLEQGKEEIDAAGAKIKKSKQELDSAKAELEASEKQIKDGWQAYYDGFKELDDADEKYQDGVKEYEKGKKKADKEFKKAEKKIAKAKKDLRKLEKGKWYVLDRNKIQSYVEYGQDSDRIGAVGTVFPMIFFLVAALVSLTTMTRMVDTQRTQMGTMKALGYTKQQIIGKYLIYAGLATAVGSVIGFLVGEKVLPLVIINAYGMMYIGIHEIVAPYHFGLAVIAAGLSFVITLGATFLSSYRALMETPASLMRPEAPKEGKRVLLERIPFLWKHISFSWKSSIRNLFRYKKRFLMTIFGIGGSMALLLVGYGLMDSISAVTDNQFQTIKIYDAVVAFDEDDEALSDNMKAVSDSDNIKMSTKVRENSIDIENANGSRSGYLIVPEHPEEIEDYIVFRNRETKEVAELKDQEVVITEKICKMLDIHEGDTIMLKEGETKKVEVKVGAISENYINHYIYMSPALYETLYKKAPIYNELLARFSKDTVKSEDAFATKALGMDGVDSVSFTRTSEDEMADMLGNLDLVIYILIFAAGLLSFVVLYNLNNINIEERRRELATIKVLGFYQNELAMYIYRENVILTLFGEVAGIFLGIALHRYVILTCEIDTLMFGRMIHPKSYIISAVLTFLFSVIVNVVMYFKLHGIDMVESLKSVE